MSHQIDADILGDFAAPDRHDEQRVVAAQPAAPKPGGILRLLAVVDASGKLGDVVDRGVPPRSGGLAEVADGVASDAENAPAAAGGADGRQPVS